MPIQWDCDDYRQGIFAWGFKVLNRKWLVNNILKKGIGVSKAGLVEINERK